jgi:hypothetical protein
MFALTSAYFNVILLLLFIIVHPEPLLYVEQMHSLELLKKKEREKNRSSTIDALHYISIISGKLGI